jgi:hypothetical protein
MSANDFAPLGMFSISSGGLTPSPSQVNRLGMLLLFSKAGLLSFIYDTSSADTEPADMMTINTAKKIRIDFIIT